MENYNQLIKEFIDSNIKELKFDNIEQDVYKFICKMGIDITKTILEEREKILAKNRDKKYISKGNRKTTVKSVYGEVSYLRKQYINSDTKKYEWLPNSNVCAFGLFSEGMLKVIEEVVVNNSYRESKRIIESLTNQTISHQALWAIIQYIGENKRMDMNNISEMNNNKPISTDVLFNEMDGIWINQQGGKKPMFEVKVSSSYTGWSSDGKLENLLTFASVTTNETFKRIREDLIDYAFDLDSNSLILLNSDGAKWIRKMIDTKYVYQLDRFHLCRAITSYVNDKEEIVNIQRLIASTTITNVLHHIEDLIANEKGFVKKKKLKTLYTYIMQNYDGIGSYKDRIHYNDYLKVKSQHNMGIQESINYKIVAKRMKHKRMSWTVNGANNILAIICDRSNKFYGIDINNCILNPYIFTDDVEEDIGLKDKYAKTIQNKSGKGDDYYLNGKVMHKDISKIGRIIDKCY